MMKEKTGNNKREILMMEYKVHKAEVLHHLQFYQSLSTQFQFLFGATITLLSFVIANPNVRPNISTWSLWWCGSFAAPLIVSYQTLSITQSI